MHMGGLTRLDSVEAVIAALFPANVSVAVTDPRAPQPALLPGEDTGLSRALPPRLAEFTAGRAVARKALARLGRAGVAIPAGEDRLPQWPAGITGSISHSGSLCAAAVSDAPLLLGLDLEPDTRLEADLIPTICSDAEAARIAGPDQGRLAKLVFSAKEAAYKAQFPLTRQLFGFDRFDIAFAPDTRRFTATFTKATGVFASGDVLQGRYDHVADHTVTAAAVPHPLSEGG